MEETILALKSQIQSLQQRNILLQSEMEDSHHHQHQHQHQHRVNSSQQQQQHHPHQQTSNSTYHATMVGAI